MLAYNISACEVCTIRQKPTEALKKSIANRRVKDWETSNGHTKDTIRLFEGPLHDPVGEHICVQPFRMWNRLCFHPFFACLTNISKTQKRCTKQDFEIKLNLTWPFNQPPNNRDLNQVILHLWSKFGGSSLNG